MPATLPAVVALTPSTEAAHWRSRAERAELAGEILLEHIRRDQEQDEVNDAIMNACAEEDRAQAAAYEAWQARVREAREQGED